jgi:predicted 2-oxoglutarate/Fe(II)-dependent dioxygenase YbiX
MAIRHSKHRQAERAVTTPARVLNLLERLPPPGEASGALATAPILILPDVLEPE